MYILAVSWTSVEQYFSIHPAPKGLERSVSDWITVVQYGVFVLGIFIQPFFAEYQKSRRWSFAGMSGWLAFSFLMGLFAFPAVYHGAFNPEKSTFVQLAAIFGSGIGWQSLFDTATASLKHT